MPKPEYKRCSKCRAMKALYEFSPHRATRDGRNSQCKACSNAEQKAREARRIRECARCKKRKQATCFPPHSRECAECAPPHGFRRCGECGLTKPLDDFHKDSKARHGRSSKCKPCVGSRTKAWGEANHARKKANENRWREEHPEQVKALRRAWDVENPGSGSV